jgi:hypothetical protein
MEYPDPIERFFGPDTLDKFAARVERLCNCETRRPASDEEQIRLLTALIFARKWAELHHVTFAWQRDPATNTKDGQMYQLWRVHLSIGDRYLLCMDETDFGPDKKPGLNDSELWCEATAALMAMRQCVWPDGFDYSDDDDDEDFDDEE